MSQRNSFRPFIAALVLGLTAIAPGTVLAQAAPASTTATAPVAATAASGAADLAADKDAVSNPYGLDALWKGGDFVAKGTLLILLLMSAGSWYIVFTKLYEQNKLTRQGKNANETFWSAGALELAVEGLDKSGAYHFIAKSGTDANSKHRGLAGHIALNDWIQLSIQRATEKVQGRLQKGLAFLATVGSTAPFVGLFGTVWGIYHALTAIGIAGQASIDKVAGPVGEALIMTAIGLAVAVPAVLGYNWLVRRNKAALDNVRGFGAELHAVLLGAEAARQEARSQSHKAPLSVAHAA